MKNIYKGLILKDLLNLKGYKFTIIVFIVIFTLVSISQENSFYLLPLMITIGIGIFGISSFSYDELAKSDKYMLTMPITKKDIVISKYILVMLFNISGAIFGIVVSCILQYIFMGEIGDILELVTYCIGGIFGITLVQAIQIPIIFKKGAIKGRIYLFAIFGILGLLATGLVLWGGSLNVEIPLNELDSIPPLYVISILLVLTGIIDYISYRISYGVYRKKEIN